MSVANMIDTPPSWYEIGQNEIIIDGDRCNRLSHEWAQVYDSIGKTPLQYYHDGSFRVIRRGVQPLTVNKSDKEWLNPWDQ